MTKINKKMFLLLFVILLTISTVSGEPISKFKITDYAEPYLQNEEVLYAYGPYYYQENPYYVIDFWDNDDLLAEMVFDANTGKVIENEKTAKQIIYGSLVIESIDSDLISSDVEYASNLRTTIDLYNDEYEFWHDISIKSWVKSVDADHAKRAADISKSLEESYSRSLEITNEIIAIENDIIGKEWTIENAELYVEKSDQYIYETDITKTKLNEGINEFPEIYDAFINNNYYNVDNTEWETYKRDDINYFTTDIDNVNAYQSYWKSYKLELNDDTEWFFESMQSRIESNNLETSDDTNSTPGFAFSIAIPILLSMAFIVRRREMN